MRRKQLILPAEHGSWAWLLVPFFVGTAVAGRFNLPLLLVLVSSLALFLLRQPMTVWLRVRRGKAAAKNGRPALAWIISLNLIGLLSLAGLLALGRTALLWLGIPFAIVLMLYLAAARYGRTGLRSLWMEIIGAAALALTAPAALIAAQGRVDDWLWLAGVWGLLAGQNVLGALYVRRRIADTHGRDGRRWPLVAAHLLGLLIVIGIGLWGIVPLATAVPFAAFLLRALWAAQQSRPIPDVKKFGFIEVGVEIAGGLWFVISYMM